MAIFFPTTILAGPWFSAIDRITFLNDRKKLSQFRS